MVDRQRLDVFLYGEVMCFNLVIEILMVDRVVSIEGS